MFRFGVSECFARRASPKLKAGPSKSWALMWSLQAMADQFGECSQVMSLTFFDYGLWHI